MDFTPYYFRMSQGPYTHVRAWLNDIPFYRFYGGPSSVNRSGPAIHLLHPGENTFAIEIDRAPEGTEVFFELMINFDHKSPVLYFEWPREAKHLPADRWTPFRWETEFTPPGDMFTPLYLSSVPEEFPCEGTPDLWNAVRRVQDAIEGHDLDAFCAALAEKANEHARAYPGWPDSTAEDMRADMKPFFQGDLRVVPLDRGDVHFERRAGGKLATALHLGGGPLIDASALEPTADGETARVRMEHLTLTRIRGQWSVVF